MSEQRELFSTSVLSDQSELKAHAALYAARERAGQPEVSELAIVTAAPRVIPQGGAAAARALREKLVAEHRAVVVEAASRFGRRENGAIPAKSILRFRLRDLPKLVRPARDPQAPGDCGSPGPQPPDRESADESPRHRG